MELTAVAVAAGVSVAALTGGTLSRLLDTPLRLPGLAVAALGVQLAAALWTPDGPLLLGAYALLAAFCTANLRLTGMSVVLLGVLLNAAVVTANGEMPDRREGATLGVLGRTVPVPEPVDRSVSFGDLILGMGVADVLVRASRRAAPPVHDHARERGDDAAVAGQRR